MVGDPRRLRDAWTLASPTTRARFLHELDAKLCVDEP